MLPNPLEVCVGERSMTMSSAFTALVSCSSLLVKVTCSKGICWCNESEAYTLMRPILYANKFGQPILPHYPIMGVGVARKRKTVLTPG